MKKIISLFIVLFCFSNMTFSQGKFVIQNKKQSDKIRFKLINNLIIIPVEINGVELSFILDTGVSKPIIFNFLNITDTLQINQTEKIWLRGLGEGNSVEALKSRNNIIKVGEAIKLNQNLFAVFNSSLNFAPRLGIPIHGIIGFDILKDFVVEINYSSRYIRLTSLEKYKYKNCRKCEQLNLEFYNNKPYINVTVNINNETIPVKLLMDSGGSDALWLFENEEKGLVHNNVFFEDFLGHGLNGSVYGKRTKIDALNIKNFKLENANVAFPDSISIALAKKIKGRNGSVGGNILKRFNLIIDYSKARITLKKNSKFKEPFEYNKSGIELAHNGVRLVKERDNTITQNSFTQNSLNDSQNQSNSNRIILDAKYKLSVKPAFTIVELRENSPAAKAGLLKGDIVISVNSNQTHNYSLHNLIELFYGKNGKQIRLKVDRNGVILNFSFRLESLLKKKTL